MADYYTVLQRAVSALPENSGAGRRAIYDKARAALVRQLETIQPPLPAAEIAKQRLSLEEAVRRIEADVARSAPPRPAAPAATAEPRREPPPRPPITRAEPPRAEPPRPEQTRPEPQRPVAPPRPEAGKPDFSKPDYSKPESGKATEAPKAETPRVETADAGKPDTARPETPAGEAPRAEAARPDLRRPDPARPAPRVEAPIRVEPRSPAARPDTAPPPAGRAGAGAPSLEGMRRDDAVDGDATGAEAPRLPPVRRPDAAGSPASSAPTITPPPRVEVARPPRPDLPAGAIVAPLPGIPGDEVDEDGDERGGRREDRHARKEKRRLARLGRTEEAAADAPDAEPSTTAETPDGDATPDADTAWLDLPPDAAPLRLPAKRRRNFGPLIAALVVLVIVAGGAAAAYVYRDTLLAKVDSMLAEEQPAPRRTPAQAQNGSDQLAPKDEDRLPSANGQNGAAGTDTRAVPTTRIVTPQTPGSPDGSPAAGTPPAGAAAPDGAAPPTDPAFPPADGTAPADGAAADPAAEVAPSPEAAGMTGPSRGILYEEGETAGAKGAALKGDVKWEMVRESIGGAPPEPIVRATIAVPERDATTTIIFRRNRDDALPASHLIEVAFELPVEFPGGGISNLPGLIMKVTENARGDALIGASARVSDGLFWIALSSSETDEAHNLELLRDRGWIDLPMLYDNGRRAILTVEKGSDGAAAIDQAITAWASEAPN